MVALGIVHLYSPRCLFLVRLPMLSTNLALCHPGEIKESIPKAKSLALFSVNVITVFGRNNNGRESTALRKYHPIFVLILFVAPVSAVVASFFHGFLQLTAALLTFQSTRPA